MTTKINTEHLQENKERYETEILPFLCQNHSHSQNRPIKAEKYNQVAPIPPESIPGELRQAIELQKATESKNTPTTQNPKNSNQSLSRAHKDSTETASDTKPTPETPKTASYAEKSKILNILRMVGFVLSNYYFGYYLVIANVLAPALTESVFEIDENNQEKVTGNFGFLFALGCIISNLLAGFLTKNIGRVKLILLMELCKIICAFLYRIENLPIFLTIRVFLGILGGIGLGLVPLLCSEMLPMRLRAYGGTSSFTLITVFQIVASLQNPLLGGKEGLVRS